MSYLVEMRVMWLWARLGDRCARETDRVALCGCRTAEGSTYSSGYSYMRTYVVEDSAQRPRLRVCFVLLFEAEVNVSSAETLVTGATAAQHKFRNGPQRAWSIVRRSPLPPPPPPPPVRERTSFMSTHGTVLVWC